MGIHVRVRDRKTGEELTVTPQNAFDYAQHLGWKRVGHVEVRDDYVTDSTELLDRLGNGRANAAQASVDPLDKRQMSQIDRLNADLDLDDDQGAGDEADAPTDDDGGESDTDADNGGSDDEGDDD